MSSSNRVPGIIPYCLAGIIFDNYALSFVVSLANLSFYENSKNTVRKFVCVPFFRLDCEIELPIPSVADRLGILRVLLARWAVGEAEVAAVARAAHGFVAADLHCLVTKAAMQAASKGKTDLALEDLQWALSQIKPSAMREVQVQVPNVGKKVNL
jgi:hypothetical protein